MLWFLSMILNQLVDQVVGQIVDQVFDKVIDQGFASPLPPKIQFCRVCGVEQISFAGSPGTLVFLSFVLSFFLPSFLPLLLLLLLPRTLFLIKFTCS